ncbi:cell division inhibition protein DicB [Escherichia coli]|uniref:cell division inhibition protein DicB n=1 Tax=Escherichia coli TaxID=562 RepID=UPI000A1729D8|nr:cell division inhibition protein DicB [Escherichia coli]OSC06405.1 cell division inhibition protein DicB [Escherichia coli]
MKTLLPNVNTSEGCFEIGVTISNPVFTEDAINKRKQERELLNKICIVSMLARLRLMPKGCVDWPPESPDNQYHLNK